MRVRRSKYSLLLLLYNQFILHTSLLYKITLFSPCIVVFLIHMNLEKNGENGEKTKIKMDDGVARFFTRFEGNLFIC